MNCGENYLYVIITGWFTLLTNMTILVIGICSQFNYIMYHMDLSVVKFSKILIFVNSIPVDRRYWPVPYNNAKSDTSDTVSPLPHCVICSNNVGERKTNY